MNNKEKSANLHYFPEINELNICYASFTMILAGTFLINSRHLLLSWYKMQLITFCSSE